MKIKNSALIYLIMILGIVSILTSNCERDEENLSNQTNGKTTAGFNPNLTYDSLTDQDGNIYKAIKIGTQTWRAENLRTTRYRNGEQIPLVISNSDWKNLSHGAYCNYNNTNSPDTIATYGRLYTLDAVIDSRNIAPEGWHVPSDAEWTTLITYLGKGDAVLGDSTAGAYLKEVGDSHWPNNTVFGDPIANNSSGFTALPCVWRTYNGFGYPDGQAVFWSSTRYSDNQAWSRMLISAGSLVARFNWAGGDLGFAVRCVKDSSIE